MTLGDLLSKLLDQHQDNTSTFIEDIVNWFIDEASDIFLAIVEMLNALVLAALAKIPLPSFIADGLPIFSGINCHVGWLLDALQFSYGVGVILSALMFRVTIRTILR